MTRFSAPLHPYPFNRKTARDGQHSDWAGAQSYVDLGCRGDGAPNREHARREPFSERMVDGCRVRRFSASRLLWR